jgi:hypothetical protein
VRATFQRLNGKSHSLFDGQIVVGEIVSGRHCCGVEVAREAENKMNSIIEIV